MSETNPLAAGDVDGDGLDDLVAAAGDGNDLHVFLNQGNGTFGEPSHAEPGQALTSLALGDLDGDGFPDVVGGGSGIVPDGNGTPEGVVVMLNDGQGGFGAGTSFTLEGAAPGEVAVADFNADGNLDVVVSVPEENSIALFTGNGNGTLDPFVAFGTTISGSELAVADFDGDGDPDLACGGAGLLPLGEEPEPTEQVAVLLNNGSGVFGEPTLLSMRGAAQTLAAGDYNADGLPDLLVATLFTEDFLEGRLELFLNDGNGGFTATLSETIGVLPTRLLSADLNGDGHQDAAVLDLYMGAFVIGWGNGQGEFPTVSGWNVGALPAFQPDTGNLNNEPLPDLAASNIPLSLGGGLPAPRIHVLNTVFR